jgi:hypothetical protein
LFLELGIVTNDKCDRLPGSGVDLTRFEYTPLDIKENIRFLLVARLIAEKEYIFMLMLLGYSRKNIPSLNFVFLDQ